MKFLKVVISAVCLCLGMQVSAVTIGGAENVPESEVSTERSLRGDLISFDPNTRLLKSSIGEYTVGSAISVLDTREVKEGGQVSLYFRGDQLIRVVLY